MKTRGKLSERINEVGKKYFGIGTTQIGSYRADQQPKQYNEQSRIAEMETV